MKTIDVVTTATIRPSIINVTYDSFCRKMFSKDYEYRLIINVDPIGDTGFSQDDVLEVAKKYFKNIVFNFPKEPSFAKAVRWAWGATESDYVFHLEDDWLLQMNVDINDFVGVIDRHDHVGYIGLKKNGFVNIVNGKKMIFDWASKSREDSFRALWRISFNPGMYKGRMVRELVPIMVDTLNPESQLSPGWATMMGEPNGKLIDNVVSRYDKIMWEKVSSFVVRDTGREWRKKMGIIRQPDFLNWSSG